MSHMIRHSSVWSLVGLASLFAVAGGCRPSDVLDVPPPSGLYAASSVTGTASAEEVFDYGKYMLFWGLEGTFNVNQTSALLSDEFVYTLGTLCCSSTIDARYNDVGASHSEPGNYPLQNLFTVRSQLLVAIPLLQKYETGAGLARVGEAYALIGFAELYMAEDYCAGVTLSQDLPAGGVVYGHPLTTDSLLAVAASHFDSAIAYANGNDTITYAASVGKGRAMLSRGGAYMDSAAAAVNSVPTNFVYNAELAAAAAAPPYYFPQNFYAQSSNYGGSSCAVFNVSDREGTNGLNFGSAGDPRLAFNPNIMETCDGVALGLADSVFNYPVKFGNPSANVPLATGIEARLIEAEDALHDNQVNTWASDLRALRADSADTHVAFSTALPTDSAETAVPDSQISLMYRERAFWLFGTGTRLGDMRRLIRIYGRASDAVFPVGPYQAAEQSNAAWKNNFPAGIPTYGPDVNLTLPTPQAYDFTSNPYYKGCITSTQTA